MMERSLETAESVSGRMLAGEIAARPADRRKCGWCDFQDLCRIESEATPVTISVGGQRN
jgi:hypothetical protein